MAVFSDMYSDTSLLFGFIVIIVLFVLKTHFSSRGYKNISSKLKPSAGHEVSSVDVKSVNLNKAKKRKNVKALFQLEYLYSCCT